MEDLLREFGEWLCTLDENSPPRLTGEMLFDAVHAEASECAPCGVQIAGYCPAGSSSGLV